MFFSATMDWGPYVVEQLSSLYDFGPEVELVDAGTPALDFCLYFADADLLIVVDAVKSTAPAGTILSYSREDILRHSAPLRVDAHSPALGHALMFGDFAGAAPHEVTLFGVSIANHDPGTQLSPAVRGAIPALLDRIVEAVRAQEVSANRRRMPRPLQIWWEKAS